MMPLLPRSAAGHRRRVTYILTDSPLSRVGAARYYARTSRQEGLMAKVSWNKTWSLKMRKKSRGKKGKNRSKKK
jgi:hypothetical protein